MRYEFYYTAELDVVTHEVQLSIYEPFGVVGDGGKEWEMWVRGGKCEYIRRAESRHAEDERFTGLPLEVCRNRSAGR